MTTDSLHHEQCQELLPAYVHGRLSSEQQRQVQEHIAHCEQCFAQHQQAVTLAQGLNETPPELEALLSNSRMEKNLAGVLAQIDQLEGSLGNSQEPTPQQENIESEKSPKVVQLSSWRRTPKAMQLAFAGQAACLLIAIAVLLYPATQQPQIQQYQTLSDPKPSPTLDQQQYRLVFQTDATESDIRQLLSSVNGQITGGPTTAGVYTIATADAINQANAQVLRQLRSNPWVRLAEPVSHNRP